jgi:hypothetical protein
VGYATAGTARSAGGSGRSNQKRPGAAELAGDRSVGLLEATEHPSLEISVEADAGVADGEQHAATRPLRMEVHTAAFGELDGV